MDRELNQNSPIYEHNQSGLRLLVILAIPAIGLVFAVALSGEPEALLPLMMILALMLLTGAIFSSLTVTVDTRQVRLHFGLGFFGRSIAMERISAVQMVRNPAWMGLGIHFIPGGMIYNVWGLDGVELRLDNGRVVRIGTDEPYELAHAVEAARQVVRTRI